MALYNDIVIVAISLHVLHNKMEVKGGTPPIINVKVGEGLPSGILPL